MLQEATTYRRFHRQFPSYITKIRLLVAHCPAGRMRHFADEIYVQDEQQYCCLTNSVVEPLETPIPIHLHHFVWYQVTVTKRTVIGCLLLHPGITFTLSYPRLLDGCVQVKTRHYGMLAIPLASVEMVPCAAPTQTRKEGVA